MPSGNFTVHPFLHSKLPYDPNDLNPIVRTSQHHSGCRIGEVLALQHHPRVHRGRAGQSRQVQFRPRAWPDRVHLLGYTHHENLNITQVPYRDINLAPTDLAAGGASRWSWRRLRSCSRNGALTGSSLSRSTTRRVQRLYPAFRPALEEGYPSPGIRRSSWPDRPKDHVEGPQRAHRGRFQSGGGDGSIASRLAATGSVINVGGPDEFSPAIDEQRATIARHRKSDQLQTEELSRSCFCG